MRLIFVALASALLAAPAFAQDHARDAPACAAMDAALPAGLGDWTGKADIGTAPSPEHAAHASLALGKGY